MGNVCTFFTQRLQAAQTASAFALTWSFSRKLVQCMYDICAALPFNLGLTGTRIPVKVQDYRENQGNSRQAIY